MAKVQTKEQEKPQFDPTVPYGWSADDEFVITGKEFEMINNALKAHVGSEEFQKFLSLYKGLEVVDKIFIKGIEQGVIKPRVKQKHILTEEDFKNNPDLEKEGLKVGEEIEY